jgi:KDO2-lipid IV(A) lauroyltransferase
MNEALARHVPSDPRDRRDLRQGGSWTHTQALKNAVIVQLVRGVLALLVPLSPRLLRAFGRFVGRLAFSLLSRERATALSNVARAFPAMSAEEGRAFVQTSYVTLGEHLGDALASLDPKRPIEPLPIDEASLAMLTRSDRGVVFASAHLGPWERVAHSLVHHGVRLTTLARESYDPRLSHVYERLRAARGVGAIYRGRPGAAARIVRTLRAGGVLGVPMDLRSRVPSIAAPFLGHCASTPVGPARIALRTGAAVVVGTAAPLASESEMQRGGHRTRRLRITCTEIRTDDLRADEASERTLTARINDELSARILALPNEWVWMHDRFADSNPVHSTGSCSTPSP